MNERNYAIDFIRIFSIIGVVLIHTTTAFSDRLPTTSFDFYIIHFLNQFARFSVPLFFAISGFLLGAKYGEIKDAVPFYKKKLSKILIPYFSWSLIYYLLVFPNPNSVLSRDFLNNLLTGDASYQLYFIPAIIILYLLFPLIVVKKKIFLDKKFVVGLFILEAVVLTTVYYSSQEPKIFPPLKIAFYNLLPFIVGIYVAVNKVDIYKFTKRNISKIIIVEILLALFLFFESYLMYTFTNVVGYLRNQWRISVSLYGLVSGGVFYYLFLTYGKSLNRVVSLTSGYAFGIFFIHVAILHYVLIFVDRYQAYGLISFLAVFSLISVFSLYISILFSRIKLVNKVLGLKS